MTCPTYRAPAGPNWVPDAEPFVTVVTDRDGHRWLVERIEQGGRVLHWHCMSDGRTARTEATPAHPAYPDDATLLERERAAKRAAVARGYWP